MICQIAAWDVFKIIMPVMYIVCMWIIAHGPNSLWLTGFGISVYQYAGRDKLVHETFLRDVTVKLIVLLSIDLMLMGTEQLVLYAAKLRGFFDRELNFLRTMSICCRDYGNCIASLLAFMLPTFLCAVAVACGMDFTMKFEWFKHRGDANYFTSFQS